MKIQYIWFLKLETLYFTKNAVKTSKTTQIDALLGVKIATVFECAQKPAVLASYTSDMREQTFFYVLVPRNLLNQSDTILQEEEDRR